jgi:hypothetical protein
MRCFIILRLREYRNDVAREDRMGNWPGEQAAVGAGANGDVKADNASVAGGKVAYERQSVAW